MLSASISCRSEMDESLPKGNMDNSAHSGGPSHRLANAYQMIKTLEIKRFRGFSDARLSDCRRINIVVGENGSGKTSFLEALFIAAGGSPEIAVRLRAWRGLGEGVIQGSPAQIEDAMWRDLFHGFNKDKAVSITLRGSSDNTRSVRISYNEQSALVPISGRKDLPLTATAPVLFKWQGPQEQTHSVRPVIENGSIKLPAGPRLPTETNFFPSNSSVLESFKSMIAAS